MNQVGQYIARSKLAPDITSPEPIVRLQKAIKDILPVEKQPLMAIDGKVGPVTLKTMSQALNNKLYSERFKISEADRALPIEVLNGKKLLSIVNVNYWIQVLEQIKALKNDTALKMKQKEEQEKEAALASSKPASEPPKQDSVQDALTAGKIVNLVNNYRYQDEPEHIKFANSSNDKNNVY